MLNSMHGNDVKFYKYLSPEAAASVLDNGTLKWSSPKLFNDPFDFPYEMDFSFDGNQLAEALTNELVRLAYGPDEPSGNMDNPLFLMSMITRRNPNVPGEVFKVFPLLVIFSGVMAEPERVVVYGENHIFSIERAENWILDRELAASQQLGSFFYPAESQSKTETYFYAQGWDKPSKDSTLQEFIDSDISQFKEKFPGLTYEKTKQGTAGLIHNAWVYTYSDMGDRFKEEVFYLESDTAVITLVFSAKNKESYEKYVKDFDKMASSFKYLSSDPEEIKRALEDTKELQH